MLAQPAAKVDVLALGELGQLIKADPMVAGAFVIPLVEFILHVRHVDHRTARESPFRWLTRKLATQWRIDIEGLLDGRVVGTRQLGVCAAKEYPAVAWNMNTLGQPEQQSLGLTAPRGATIQGLFTVQCEEFRLPRMGLGHSLAAARYLLGCLLEPVLVLRVLRQSPQCLRRLPPRQ